MYRTQFLSDEELMEMKVDGDLYYSRFTFLAATMAVGGVIQCTDMVTSSFSESTRAIALVRPPGHHAEKDAAGGTLLKCAGPDF
jgi:histone deacetylase 6